MECRLWELLISKQLYKLKLEKKIDSLYVCNVFFNVSTNQPINQPIIHSINHILFVKPKLAQIIGNAFRVTGVVCESCFNTSWLQAVELTATMSMVALCLADSPMTAASVQTNIFQWIFVESIVLFVSNFLTRSLSNPDGTFFFKSNWILYGNSYIAGFLPAATCWHSSLLTHHCDSGESPTSKCPSLPVRPCDWSVRPCD